MLLEKRREAIIALATEGDRLGYDGFFMPEGWAYDMTVMLAEAATLGRSRTASTRGDAKRTRSPFSSPSLP
jgi:alkanesulfonate monooxygenase SsuD/methylene tetrahydromethanopterin reductase-like flavin-dependent oxidoreductase (luciferase family)